MKNIKNIVKGIAVASLLVGMAVVSPLAAKADNNGKDSNSLFVNAQAALKANGLLQLESSTGAVIGANGSVRVLGAKVVSVSGSQINATAAFGSSTLNFVINTDANTKLNGSKSSVSSLKAGDKISFSGTMSSSTSSSIVVAADHVVSRAFVGKPSDIQAKTNFEGQITAVNTADNSLSLKLRNGVAVKVAVPAGVAITLNGSASSLSSLAIGQEVRVSGTLSSDGTVITATKIAVSSNVRLNDEDNGDKADDSNKGDNGNRGWLGNMINWLRK